MRGTKRTSATGSINASTRALADTLENTYPRCKGNLNGYRCQRFAITIATQERKDELLSFIQAAKRFDWRALSKFQQFDSTKNALEVFALSCPSGDLSMLLVRNPFELFDSHALEAWDPLSVEGAENWRALLPDASWEVRESV